MCAYAQAPTNIQHAQTGDVAQGSQAGCTDGAIAAQGKGAQRGNVPNLAQALVSDGIPQALVIQAEHHQASEGLQVTYAAVWQGCLGQVELCQGLHACMHACLCADCQMISR